MNRAPVPKWHIPSPLAEPAVRYRVASPFLAQIIRDHGAGLAITPVQAFEQRKKGASARSARVLDHLA